MLKITKQAIKENKVFKITKYAIKENKETNVKKILRKFKPISWQYVKQTEAQTKKMVFL